MRIQIWVMRMIFITGIMAFRSEQWIARLSIRAALQWCDHLVIWNHMPTPSDVLFIEQLPERNRITHAICEDPDWNEMQHRQSMIEIARRHSPQTPTHLSIVDADEVASLGLRSRIRDCAEKLEPGQIATFPLKNLRRGWQYHSNGLWGSKRIISTVWREQPGIRYAGHTFHKREPLGTRMVNFPHEDPVVHGWGFSERRLIAKHRSYRCSERIQFPNKDAAEIEFTYSQYCNGGRGEDPSTWTYAPVPLEWIPEEERALVGGDEDLWQEAYVREVVANLGRERFTGLSID